MIVSCPHCAAVYELPMHLLGEGGAAVRCPHCTREFTVSPEGKTGAPDAAAAGGTHPPEPVAAHAREEARAPERAPARPREAAPAPAPAPAPASARAAAEARSAAEARATAAPPATDLHAIARRVLDSLAARKGRALNEASAGGRLFAEFGAELIAAFDEYRREAGGTENPSPFREALRERWGIDLSPPAP